MNKKNVILAVIKALDMEKKKLQASLDTTHREMIEAPSAMQSYSDTSRFQLGLIVDSGRRSVSEHEKAIEVLGSFSRTDGGKRLTEVCLGALMTLETEGGDRKTQILLPVGGGTKVTVDESTVFVITPAAPLAAALSGKKAGEQVEFKVGNDRLILNLVEIC